MTLRTVMELRGIPCIDIDHAPQPKKTIVCSRSFGEPITDLQSMQEAIAMYVSRAAVKLRRQKSVTNCLVVFLRTNPFKDDGYYSNGATAVLSAPTAYTPELLNHAKALTESIFKDGLKYKKAGVMLLDIAPDSIASNTLFSNLDYDKNETIMKALDDMNKRYGRDFVRFASSGLRRTWSMKSEQCSPRFTTEWDEILKIRV